MADKKRISPMKVAVAGVALAAGTYAAVKLAKKENREKVRKLIDKYTKSGMKLAKSAETAIDRVLDKAHEIKEIVREEGSAIKKHVKKV